MSGVTGMRASWQGVREKRRGANGCVPAIIVPRTQSEPAIVQREQRSAKVSTLTNTQALRQQWCSRTYRLGHM